MDNDDNDDLGQMDKKMCDCVFITHESYYSLGLHATLLQILNGCYQCVIQVQPEEN